MLRRLLGRLIAFPSLMETDAGLSRSRGGPVLFSFPIYRVDDKRHLEIFGRTVFGPGALLGLFVFVAVFVAMAATGTSASNAVAIAGVLAVLLPFGLKIVPAAGHYMVAISMAASVVVAAIAEIASGEIVLSNLSATNGSLLLATVLSVYALSQAVYAILTQSPKTAKLVQ
jgi:hypothetical protein